MTFFKICNTVYNHGPQRHGKPEEQPCLESFLIVYIFFITFQQRLITNSSTEPHLDPSLFM